MFADKYAEKSFVGKAKKQVVEKAEKAAPAPKAITDDYVEKAKVISYKYDFPIDGLK